MQFPTYRARRVRDAKALRNLLRETNLSVHDLIAPLWVCGGKGVKREHESLPGVSLYSPDMLKGQINELRAAGLSTLLLFGMATKRDEAASEAIGTDSTVVHAIESIRDLAPDMVVISDLDLSAYTSTGKAGVGPKNTIDNDATLEILAEMALAHARAGVDMVSPSASMDGQVGWVRETLDEEDFERVGILSCSIRYNSAYATRTDSPCKHHEGQNCHDLCPENVQEALKEATLDVEEGADMIMIRPALPFLDVVSRLSDEIELPLIGFSDHGEYAMIETAAEKGCIDRTQILLETIMAIKRAGADAVVSYHALDAAKAL